MKISAIIPAAGSGTRYGKNKPKLLEKINGIPVIVHTLKKISSINDVEEIIICTSKELIEDIQILVVSYNISKKIKIILGGKTRQESVFKGLNEVEYTDYVLIHDAARPLIDEYVLNGAIVTAENKGSAVVAVKCKDTMKKADASLQVKETIDRSNLWNIQTPQIFKYSDILDAHNRLKVSEEEFTDDSMMLEKLGYKVFLHGGNYKNIKITTREDLVIASCLLDLEE